MGEQFTVEVNSPIVPVSLIWNQQLYEIVGVHPSYVMNKYTVHVDDSRNITELYIWNSFHPNAGNATNEQVPISQPPRMSKFCLPPELIGTHFELPDTTYFLEQFVLNRWYLDNPHHYPNPNHYKTEPDIGG